MIQTDICYNRPVVYKMVTSNRDKYIQLDTWERHNVKESSELVLANTHLKPVSFVSNNAGVYHIFEE